MFGVQDGRFFSSGSVYGRFVRSVCTTRQNRREAAYAGYCHAIYTMSVRALSLTLCFFCILLRLEVFFRKDLLFNKR